LCKKKVNLSLCLIKHYAMKTHGKWRYISNILDLDTSWRWVVSFTTRPLYHGGKSTRYPLHRRLGGSQSQFGRCGEEKNLSLPRTEPQPSSP
jgi:hypothetical protein